jgi:DNA-directed RNA polymerase subunit RPC12/RpoP
MSFTFFLTCILIALLCFVLYRYSESTRPKVRCQKCGGVMLPDRQKYRYTIEWKCVECGDSVEQLRS